jgi:hypothetical protein
MKSTTKVFCLTSVLLAASASAYGVATHSAITEQAVRRLAQEGLNSHLRDLGANVGLLSVDSIVSDTAGFPNRMPAIEWIRLGAVQEDSFDCGGDRCMRFINHFYNPTAVPGEEGYRYWPLWGLSSVVWGLEATGNPSQDFSYHDAKEYMYQTVLAPTERERKQSLAALLRATGHVVHLIQDLAQPQHTRNDSHGSDTFSLNRTGYETFVNDGLIVLPFSNYPVVPFDAPEDYWITPDGRGLADYTNRGFITAGTNFTGHHAGDELRVFPNPSFPAPGGVGTTIERRWITDPDLLGPAQHLGGQIWFVANPVTDSFLGVTETNPRASAFSIFADDLIAAGGDWIFSVNRFTYQSARDMLIPRAVGYSAGMIDYMFRGKLTIGPPQVGAYAVADHSNAEGFQELKATVTNATPGEAMIGGTLIAVAKYHRNQCYQPDLSGEFTRGPDGRLIAPCPRYRSQEEFMSVAEGQTLTLNSGDQVELTFSFDPPIPMDATDVYLQVVYRGPLVPELAGRTEPDGIAVGIKDISEPTFLAIFNATDLFVLPSATGPRFHYYQDIIDNLSEYPLIDRNENGDYDPPEDVEIRGGNIRYDIYLSGGWIAASDALPEGRFFRLAMLVDPQPVQIWVHAFGTRFNQWNSYQFPPRTAQLDHSDGSYTVPLVADLRGTKQTVSIPYYYHLAEGANPRAMQRSRAQDAATPFPLSDMPAVGVLAQGVEPPAASRAGDASVPIVVLAQ